jgi:hypothetical protein
LFFFDIVVYYNLRIAYNTLHLWLFTLTVKYSRKLFGKLSRVLECAIIIKSYLWLINRVVGILFNILNVFNQLVLQFIFEISCWSIFILWQYVWLIMHHLCQTLNLCIFICKYFNAIFIMNWFKFRIILNCILFRLLDQTFLAIIVLISKVLLKFIIILKCKLLFFLCIFLSLNIILVIKIELINIFASWTHGRLWIKLSHLYLFLCIDFSRCVWFLICSCVKFWCINLVFKINLEICIIYIIKFWLILLNFQILIRLSILLF